MVQIKYPEIAVRFNKEELREILSALCKKTLKEKKADHILGFNGTYLSDVRRSGDHPDGTRGIECYLEIISKGGQYEKDIILVSVEKNILHFPQQVIDEALKNEALKIKFLPQGQNVNAKTEVLWGPHLAEVEVIISYTFDSSDDHQ